MLSLIDTKIAACASWEEFCVLANSQKNSKEKGDLFERLTQIYLQTHPTYRSKIKHVWWCNKGELPEKIREKLNLPEGDEGIDLLCETFEGEYWSVQSKYRSDSSKPLNTTELGKFLTLSFVTGKNIVAGLVVHTQSKKVQKSHLMGNTYEIGLQNWLNINTALWQQIIAVCKENILRPPTKRRPRRYQEKPIIETVNYFKQKSSTRGKLIMPCGTGKSLMAYWIAREIKAKSIIIAVPALALLKQTLEDWTSEYLAEGLIPEWIAICNDTSTADLRDADSTVASVYEAGIPVTTNIAEIQKFLKSDTKNIKIIFTTYNSGPNLAKACKSLNIEFELLIADEAHKTVGPEGKSFSTLLFDENVRIKKRLFMTATERVYTGRRKDVVSMDDTSVFGDIAHQMSFKQAIEAGAICDYKIVTMAISENEVAQLIHDEADILAKLKSKKIKTDAYHLAVGLAVKRLFKKYETKHVISFHSDITRANNFCNQLAEIDSYLSKTEQISYRHINAKKFSAGQRAQILKQFAEDESALITNSRCLTEGVDVPSIDGIVFVDPKKSKIDIVQAAGRAMRLSKDTGKEDGYILLPIVVPEGQSLEEFSQSTNFETVANVINQLASTDERIEAELRMKKLGKRKQSNSDIVITDEDILEVFKVDYASFSEAISVRLWDRIPVRKLTVDEILEWAKHHFEATGDWPTYKSGNVLADETENWGAIRSALVGGSRGLPRGLSIEKLLYDKLGVVGVRSGKALTEDLIIKMAKAHHKKTGKYPTSKSAWVLEGSDSWASISYALASGIRGLSGGSSLAKLLEERGLKRNFLNIIYPNKEEILQAGINFRDNNDNGKFPTKEAGQVSELPSFTWGSLNEALKKVKIEGIPNKTTLADLWVSEFNQRNQNNLPDFSISEILEWCDLYEKNHNEFPVLTSTPIPEMGQETFRTIDVALIYGRRGLKNSGFKSLSNLLVRERGKKSSKDLPDLEIKKIKIWMLQWYLNNLSWPTAGDGEVPSSGGEKWSNLNASMFNGSRGLEKTSVAKIKSGLINELDNLPTTSESTELEDKVRALLSVYKSRNSL